MTSGAHHVRDKILAVAAVLVALALLAGAGWWILRESGPPSSRRVAATPPAPPALEPQLYKPLTPDDALAENAALPFSTAPIERAAPLVLPLGSTDIVGRRSSLDCLTAAIYYEAGQESDQGKRGVAQVILNRARHPAFPNTICGVVYQGSERRTGCQFTFTCDGSLARRPSRQGWDAARRIALAALSGVVEPSVGMATHYHADYVVPYWAPTLAKITQVDHHIFYRWAGGWGRRSAFTQSISQEQLLADQPQLDPNDSGLDPAAIVPSPSITPISPRLVADEVAGTVSINAVGPAAAGAKAAVAADENPGRLAADDARGTLKSE
ncbi:MAG: cell wall hydrolase [Sphingopyxis sp.]|nr:cell wall hydrolase [Sphingopyxis sp.]